MKSVELPSVRPGERGFTLIEALVAMVILAFGMIAVTNLMLVAASSNTAANQGTAATTAATEAMERLKAARFGTLAPGGSLTTNASVSGVPYFRDDKIPGVGTINTRWVIAATPNPLLKFITVRSEGQGTLARSRSTAVFTTFRSCTVIAVVPGGGCPGT